MKVKKEKDPARVRIGRKSRRKGVVAEREVTRILQSYGFDARRGQQRRGGPGSPDVICPDFPCAIEVKRRQAGIQLASAIERLRQDSEGGALPPLVIHRRDNEPWIASMTLTDFLALVGGQPQQEKPNE